MAQPKSPAQQSASIKELESKLRQIGFKPGPYAVLLDRAVRESWSVDRLIVEIRASQPFQVQFPGIPDTMTPATYRQVETAYKNVAGDFNVTLDRARLGVLFRQQKSPDEFRTDAMIFDAVHKTEGLRQAFNQVLSQSGREQLDKLGWFKFLARKAPAHLYDAYEAASLKLADIGLSTQGAREVAHAVGAPGQLTDVGQLAEQVRQLHSEVAPELARAGIHPVDVAMLAAGVDPFGIAPQVQQILRNRKAVSQTVGGGRSRPTQQGGIGLFPSQPEGR